MKTCSAVFVFSIVFVSAVDARDHIAGAKVSALLDEINSLLLSQNATSRRLQTGNDVCTAPTSTSIFRFGLSGQERDWFVPSFYQNCAESIPINDQNMLLHLIPLQDIFRQYHCFHDIAKDPINSDPISYQPELGNTVFDEDGGAVDIEAGLQSIADTVLTEGASMATFWKIEELFAKLYDGHVDSPNVEGSFYSNALAAFPKRFINRSGYRFRVGYSFQQGKISVTLQYRRNGSTEELTVNTVNGVPIHDFILSVANNPAVKLTWQSSGTRVSDLLRRGVVFFGLPLVGNPLDVLPDSFIVTYVGGGQDEFVTGILASPAWYGFFDVDTIQGQQHIVFQRQTAQNFMNQPGDQFDAYQRAVDIETVNDGVKPGQRRLRKAERQSESKLIYHKLVGYDVAQNYSQEDSPQQEQHDRRAQFVFDDEPIPDIGAYKIEDDYAVLKLQSFRPGVQAVFDLWQDVASAASQQGVSTLVIDLSRNGGGLATSSLLFLILMFPEVDLRWLENQWDINYNLPMTEFLEVLLPTLDTLREDLGDVPRSDYQDVIDNADFESLDSAVDVIVELCQDADGTGLGQSDSNCLYADYLRQNVTSFAGSPSIQTYNNVLNALWAALNVYNPWSVVLEGRPQLRNQVFQAGPQTVIRGGVESNVTTKFNLIPLEFLESYSEEARKLPRVFTEFIFVSDGLSASGASVVPHTAVQLYKNRERTGVVSKVSLVGFSGSGNGEDMVFSSIPASVQNVHLEDPIIGDIVLGLLISLLPTTLSDLPEITQQAVEYSATVAIPPYFADTLPVMPVVNFYDKSMEPGALPLQFVKIPLDFYVQRIFSGVSFESPSDLGELYEAAIAVVSGNTPPAQPANPGPTPAPAPVPEPTLPPVELPIPIFPNLPTSRPNSRSTPAPTVNPIFENVGPTRGPVGIPFTSPPSPVGLGQTSAASGFQRRSILPLVAILCLLAGSI